MNNLDIRCGELESVMVNLNYWIQVWTETDERWVTTMDNENFEFINDATRKAFHSELNTAMRRPYEMGYSEMDKYYVMDNLVQTYFNQNLIGIPDDYHSDDA